MNPYEPPSQSESSLEDRVAKLEAKLSKSQPVGSTDSLLAVFAIMAIILTGAMLFDVLARAWR